MRVILLQHLFYFIAHKTTPLRYCSVFPTIILRLFLVQQSYAALMSRFEQLSSLSYQNTPGSMRAISIAVIPQAMLPIERNSAVLMSFTLFFL